MGVLYIPLYSYYLFLRVSYLLFFIYYSCGCPIYSCPIHSTVDVLFILLWVSCLFVYSYGCLIYYFIYYSYKTVAGNESPHLHQKNPSAKTWDFCV